MKMFPENNNISLLEDFVRRKKASEQEAQEVTEKEQEHLYDKFYGNIIHEDTIQEEKQGEIIEYKNDKKSVQEM
ncbi:MAG: hypothetical protein KJ767_00265 [Nanoarchaeota archaeon]|nr:hypothetical protein [Nanoarchaeota archaeon]